MKFPHLPIKKDTQPNCLVEPDASFLHFLLRSSLRFRQSILSEHPDSLSNEDFAHFFRMRYKDIETLIKENKMVASTEPMIMEYGFRINGKSGSYLIEMDESQIIHERLEYTLVKNKGVYFDITPGKIMISSKIFLEKSAYQEIKLSCTKYWGKHSLLSILMHESDDKADEYIKGQLSDNFKLILSFLSRISCKVKFGSRQEQGIIGLPPEIFGKFDEGTVSIEDEMLLDSSEKMLNTFFKCTSKDTTKVFYKRVRKENQIHYQLMQTKKIAGEERDIEFSMESTGTREFDS